jgi:lycopene cyclase domain-containing protein
MFPIEKYTYITVLFASILFPFAFSFENKLRFYTKWKSLIIAIILPATFFVIWDVYFTRQGIWSFNNHYIIGFRSLGLPIEEWLFFFVIPYCSIFVYEVIKSYFPKLDFNETLFWGFVLLVFVFLALAIFNFQHNYTFWNFTFNAVFLVFLLLNIWFFPNLSYLLLTFVICLVPMMIVNGILTSLPIVEYSKTQIIGLKIFSVPVEDLFYYFLLLMMNVLLFEKQLKNNKI